MKCLILAAGYATRLYPLTKNIPKPLLNVGGKTILDWLVDDIETTGKIGEYIVVTNHKFVHLFEEWACTKSMKITVLDDGTLSNEARLGAVRDIQFACDKMERLDDSLVIAGDNVLDFSLASFITFSEKKGTSCVMTYEENDLAKQQRTAIITFDENGLIVGYEEKPVEPRGNHAVPPFYFYTKSDIALVSEALECGCNSDAPGSFAAWLSKKTKMHAFLMPGRRYDVGNLESYARINAEYSGIRE